MEIFTRDAGVCKFIAIQGSRFRNAFVKYMFSDFLENCYRAGKVKNIFIIGINNDLQKHVNAQ